MTNHPTKLHAPEVNFPTTLYRQVDEAVTLLPSDETTFTHYVVPRALWEQVFAEKLDAVQESLRRGVEIDRLNRRIGELEND